MNQELSMSPNLLVAALQKPASEFTKADIVSYIKENDIRMVNFMYPAADGRLKTLNFVINNEAYLDAILTCGERVDGSSVKLPTSECPYFICPPACAIYDIHSVRKSLNLA